MTRAIPFFAAIASVFVAGAASAGLSPDAHQAILRALDDEYHAETTYAEIIRRYNADRPFSNIIRAEQTHAAALIALLEQNGLPVPANPYASGEKALWGFPSSAAEACTAGVAAEIENIRLYDEELLPAVAGYPQVTAVLTNLRNASADKHLPAFQRCASGGQGHWGRGQGGGHGKGMGKGMGGGRGMGGRSGG